MFGLAPELKLSPLLTTVTEQTVQVEPPPELTLEEKIATNYYKCDESIQYIRADTAECLDRPANRVPESVSSAERTTTPVQPKKAVSTAVRAPQGWYKKGQCTELVWSMRAVPAWGNASSWPASARNAGWYVGPNPVVGAVGQRGNHVVYVLEVRPNTVLIREANYDYHGSVRTIERPISYYTYLY